MNITRETLQKIAHLARLNVAPTEEAELVNSLNNVLTWMEQLSEVTTTGVEPLMHLSDEVNVLRSDTPGQHLPREQALANAPQQNGVFFEVVKVMD
jgi:aspartyl-tRNA(Asn)/glutamyl-tRNA(Gln) amidotransferase subunit C